MVSVAQRKKRRGWGGFRLGREFPKAGSGNGREIPTLAKRGRTWGTRLTIGLCSFVFGVVAGAATGSDIHAVAAEMIFESGPARMTAFLHRIWTMQIVRGIEGCVSIGGWQVARGAGGGGGGIDVSVSDVVGISIGWGSAFSGGRSNGGGKNAGFSLLTPGLGVFGVCGSGLGGDAR